jgi:hypothetical protein
MLHSHMLREAGGGTDGGDKAVERADLETKQRGYTEDVRLASVRMQRGHDGAVPDGVEDEDTGSRGP